MKKIFLILSAFMLTVSMWATTYTLQPGENNISAAMASLVDGDVIELQTGTYTEWSSLTFTTKVTIQAAEGAKPKLSLYDWKIQSDFEINGVEITNVSTNNYLFRVYTSVAGTVAFKNCSMQLNANVTAPQAYIIVKSENSLGNLVIDNCTFKDNATSQGAVVLASGSSTNVTNLTMKNSTAYNCGTELTVWFEGLANADIDHCTFYNCGTRVLYLKANTMNNYSVQNCVIANATALESSNYCIASYAGVVNNIVYYNTMAPRSGSTNTNCINADPKFIDPANNNFNFAFTSPLFLAATDGSHIGDPRWTVEAGDDAIAIPATLTKDDAILTGPKISKTDNGIAWGDNGNIDQDYASWVVDVAKAGSYDVVVNVSANSTTTHNFSVSLYSDAGLIETLNEPSETNGTGAKKCGTVAIATAGKYMVRLTNATKWSSATAESVSFTYLGGAIVDIPATLPNDEAILYGPKIAKTSDGIAWNDNGDATADYAVWNINVPKAGDYVVNMTVSKVNSSGHTFSIDIYNSSSEQVGTTIAEPSGEITFPAAGAYTVRLNNATQWSSAVMESVSIFYKGGAVMPIPGQLPGEEALLAGKVVRLENGSFQWPDKNDVDNHYATWNVTATAAGDVDIYLYLGTPSSGHQFTAALYDGETLKSSIAESDQVYTTGEISLGAISIPAIGAYTIRLTNATAWSSAIVDSIVVKAAEVPVEITISEDATDNSLLTENLDKTINVTLERSMPTGMFSTICLPFGASKSGQFAGAEIYYLDSTALHGDEVVLYFKENSDFYQGVPYIVKPATEVNNPTFENVVIKETEGGSTERTHAIFRGTFVQEHLTAGNENLLYLGQNNMLYFPEAGDESLMKGLRGYFEIKQEAGAPIRRASIRMGSNVVTTLDFVDGQAVPNGVFMLNGQIEIRVNGQKYMLNGSQK